MFKKKKENMEKEIEVTSADEIEEEVTEETAAEDSDTSGDDSDTVEIKEPEVELTEEEKLKNKVAELEDQLMRKAAEFENYRKRMVKQMSEMSLAANERILLEILEVVDNFNRSFEHDKGEDNDKSFREGIKLIYNQLKNLLEKYEVKVIDAVGKQFDPNLHEALMHTESEEFPDGTVSLEIIRGYFIGDRVLRHSKVAVSKGKAENTAKENNNENEESPNEADSDK